MSMGEEEELKDEHEERRWKMSMGEEEELKDEHEKRRWKMSRRRRGVERRA